MVQVNIDTLWFVKHQYAFLKYFLCYRNIILVQESLFQKLSKYSITAFSTALMMGFFFFSSTSSSVGKNVEIQLSCDSKQQMLFKTNYMTAHTEKSSYKTFR